jgi:hypothetical protein
MSLLLVLLLQTVQLHQESFDAAEMMSQPQQLQRGGRVDADFWQLMQHVCDDVRWKDLKARRLSAFVDHFPSSLLMLLEKVGIEGVIGVGFVLVYSFRFAKIVLKKEGEEKVSFIELEKDREG